MSWFPRAAGGLSHVCYTLSDLSRTLSQWQFISYFVYIFFLCLMTNGQVVGQTTWLQGGNSFGSTGVLGTSDNNHLDVYTNNTRRGRWTNTGNFLINSTTDNGNPLQVNGGNMSITSFSTTLNIGNSGTNVSYFGNSVASVQFGPANSWSSAYPLGVPGISAVATKALIFWADPGTAVLPGIGFAFQPNHYIVNNTFSDVQFLNVSGGVQSSVAGTYNHSLLTMTPTLNFTGSYNGTFRGFYYNPTITSTTGTMKHIAWENTIGNVLLGSSSGRVIIGGSTDNTTDVLQVNGTVRVYGPKVFLDGGTSNLTFTLYTQGTNIGTLTATTAGNLSLINNYSQGYLSFGTAGVEAARFTSTGNLIIGKTSQTNTGYKLDVNGSARANKVVVNTTGADFVFGPGYRLPSLVKVESFIQANHHLPDIPSAKEMQGKGLDLGDNQTRLLQKIEELTLYVIDQAKEQDRAKKELEELRKEIEAVKVQNRRLHDQLKHSKDSHAAGNRIIKTVTPNGGSLTTTLYVRDAQGNFRSI
jgi:hypothetical protein